MKKRFYYNVFLINLIVILTLSIKCLSQTIYSETLRLPVIEKFVLGDINNDGLIDTAFVYTPSRINEIPNENDSLPCKGKCYNIVTFTCGFPALKIDNSILGKIEAIDDLNGDGNREIIFQTNWFVGTHANIYIYSLIKNNWINIASDYLYEKDSYKDRIKKINDKKFIFLKEIWLAKKQITIDKKQIVKFK
jgi:hypothetical protein